MSRTLFVAGFVLLAGLLVGAGWAAAQGLSVPNAASPVGSGFTYQGRLTDGGDPANGTYDLQFALYDAASGGSQAGSIVLKDDVTVTDGLFTIQLDFGASAFVGEGRWLDIGVRPSADTGAFTVLSPRQTITPAPYAMFATKAAAAHEATYALQATTTAWGGLTGVPAGFADNTDNDTTYTAGPGLTLIGNQFSVATTSESSGLIINGSVVARNTGCPAACVLERIVIPVAVAPGATESIDLTTSTISVTYVDGDDFANLAWNANADDAGANLGWVINWGIATSPLLDSTEQAEVIVNINGAAVTTPPGASSSFIVEIKPATEKVLQVARTLPSELTAVVVLESSSTEITFVTTTESLGLIIKGSVVARSSGTPLTVERVIIPLGVASGTTDPVDLSTSNIAVTYIDADDFANLSWNAAADSAGANIGWVINWGAATPDLLDPTEQVEIVVNLNGAAVTTRPGASDSFIIEIKPATDKVLHVARTLPSEITSVVTLASSSTEITFVTTVNVSTAVEVDIKNTGNTSVSDFANMEYIIRYTKTAGGGTETAEIMAYVPGSSANGTWDIMSITPDSVQPGVWDPGETIRMSGNVSGTPMSGTTGAVWVSTPNGGVTGGTFVVP